jgi:hypothetical protein
LRVVKRSSWRKKERAIIRLPALDKPHHRPTRSSMGDDWDNGALESIAFMEKVSAAACAQACASFRAHLARARRPRPRCLSRPASGSALCSPGLLRVCARRGSAESGAACQGLWHRARRLRKAVEEAQHRVQRGSDEAPPKRRLRNGVCRLHAERAGSGPPPAPHAPPPPPPGRMLPRWWPARVILLPRPDERVRVSRR